MAVTVADVKLHLNLDHDEDDALIAMMIAEAKSWVEGFTDTAVSDTDTPAALEGAIRRFAAHLYEHRVDGEDDAIPEIVRSLCAPFIRWAV